MKKVKIIIMILVVTLVISACSPNDEKLVKNVVEDYYALLLSGDFEASHQYLDEDYYYLKNSPYGINDLDVAKKLLNLFSIEIVDIELSDNIAVVQMNITHPNPKEIVDSMAGAISFNMSDDAFSKAVDKKLDDENITMITDTAYISLTKKQNNWEIITDEYFDTLIWYGASPEYSVSSVTENELKLKSVEEYKASNIVLEDYLVEMSDTYFGEMPVIKNVSIKNNGDKQIDILKLNLEFLKDDGSIDVVREVVIFGINDSSLKPGYSWKMDSDDFRLIENLPKDVNVEKVNVSIGDIELSDGDITENAGQKSVNEASNQKVSSVESKISEEEQYIKDYINIDNYKIAVYEGYSGNEPGISNIQLKNNGDKNIDELSVTVFFQDENGKNIAENSILIIGGLFNSDPLKANYSWKMENDKYYKFENLADEVDISKNYVEVTKIKFEE